MAEWTTVEMAGLLVSSAPRIAIMESTGGTRNQLRKQANKRLKAAGFEALALTDQQFEDELRLPVRFGLLDASLDRSTVDATTQGHEALQRVLDLGTSESRLDLPPLSASGEHGTRTGA